jgi:hypothetical protein
LCLSFRRLLMGLMGLSVLLCVNGRNGLTTHNALQ